MTPEEVLKRSPGVLTQSQREFYFDNGYLLLESFISKEWLQRLQAVTDEFIDESRSVTQSNTKFDLEPGHSSENPRLRRLSHPVDQHEVFQEFSLKGPVVDLALDLLGPNVRYHHSKLNFKWGGGGEEVKWHQDIQYWPHTDFSPLTIGVYLADVDRHMAPMGVVPGSHKGELFDLYDEANCWTGSIGDKDLPRVETDKAVYLKGPAGSVTVHNCCAVHGSTPNHSSRSRLLLLQTYAAADSYPLLTVGTNGAAGVFSNTLVRGERQRWMEVGARWLPVAPDWSKGDYISIFEVQQSKVD
ncbi:MAG: phytanoyl-CoA dioxygenase family protein [Gammaproteobacteria bacterium]|nr:phytanoyl-CoA dioxygenase family protein [Gammaproteobacteria bacterium]